MTRQVGPLRRRLSTHIGSVKCAHLEKHDSKNKEVKMESLINRSDYELSV